MNLYLNEMNRRVLTGAIQGQQSQAATMQGDVQSALDAVDQINRSLSDENTVQAEQDVRALVQEYPRDIADTPDDHRIRWADPLSGPLASGGAAELGTTAALLLTLQRDASALQHSGLGTTGQETQTLARTNEISNNSMPRLAPCENVSPARDRQSLQGEESEHHRC